MRLTFSLLACLWVGACAHPGSHATTGATQAMQPMSPEALVQRARSHARAGDLLRGEQYFVLATRAGYPHDAVLPELLDVCLRASRLRAAAGHARASLRARPDQPALRALVSALEDALAPGRPIRQATTALAQTRPTPQPPQPPQPPTSPGASL